LPPKIGEIQHNKNSNQVTSIGGNTLAEKIDKNLNDKNAFCGKYCLGDDQNCVNSKKCYLNGAVKNCFTCKFKEKALNEKEKNIEKLCMNFCNHVENTHSCLYFGYINKSKKQIDIDIKILIELGIKKSYSK